MIGELAGVVCPIEAISVLDALEPLFELLLLVAHRHHHELLIVVLSLLDVLGRLEVRRDDPLRTVIVVVIGEDCLHGLELFVVRDSHRVRALFIELHDCLGEDRLFRHFEC